jgi:penicillin amidase
MSSTTTAPVDLKVGKRSALRLVSRLLLSVLLLLIVTAVALYFYAASALPQVDGTITVAGLSAPVEVIRDRQGVPHIRAQSLEDALFAQGYVTAQDRLWQMDMTRRYAAGELAEILGPDQLKHDREERILSLRQAAEHVVANLSEHQRSMVEAYTRGVNAYIESHQGKLPLEFRLIGYAPKPWKTVDCFLVGAELAHNLSHDQFAAKLLREKLTAILGPQKAKDLYTNVSWRDHPPALQMQAPKQPASNNPDDQDDMDPNDDTNVAAAFSSLTAGEEDALVPGSNDWAVSGAHTVTGKPILSSDMHLHHQIPNVWYEAHLTAPGFDVAGVTLPGLPFVIVGHNQRIAWGFTNLGPDVEDIFIENFNAGGEYQTPAGWKQPESRREVIHVKGQPDIALNVLSTRHGPIVTELVPGERRKLALEAVFYRVGVEFPFEELNRAGNWQEFRHALEHFSIPSQNAVYADVDGHIGYQSTGVIPLRRSGDGALPVSGADDRHEWTGYIPYNQMPSVYDPPTGILATANGRIAPDRYPYSISTEWGPPYRTQRLYSVLGSGNKFSVSDMLALQTDIYSDFDKFCAEQFVAAVDHSQTASKRAHEAAEIMRSWDGRLTTDSAAATITLKSERKLRELLLGPYADDYLWQSSAVAWENLLSQRPKYWLPAGFRSYDELLTAAVEQVVTASDAPSRLASWERGRAFPLEIQHPVFSKIPIARWFSGPGIVKQSGDTWTVKQVGRSFGPSERMTVDFANLDQSTLNIVTGQSGQLFSRHYMDQWKAWYEGQTFTLPFSHNAVDQAAANKLELKPKNR